MIKSILLLLCTLTALAGPATAARDADALNPDLQARIGSALLAGDPVQPALLVAGSDEVLPEETAALHSDAEDEGSPATPPLQGKKLASLDLKTRSPFTPYLGAGVDSPPGAEDPDGGYRLVAGVDCALDKSTVLNLAVHGSLPAEAGMEETLSADFEDHNVSLGLKMAF